jgi:hypothetical protein
VQETGGDSTVRRLMVCSSTKCYSCDNLKNNKMLFFKLNRTHVYMNFWFSLESYTLSFPEVMQIYLESPCILFGEFQTV